MRLWSIQNYERWQRLQHDGVLRQLRVEREERLSYSFMREQLTAKAGAAPNGRCWPIWAWHQWRGPSRPQPDLSHEEYADVDRKQVCIELEIDEKRVLLSQFSMWVGGPYGHLPVHASWSYTKKLLKRLEEAGLPWHYFGLKEILAHPRFGKLVRRSWEKVFDLDYTNYMADAPEQKRIQAVFWELRLEDVIAVRHFGASQGPLLNSQGKPSDS
jgi:hypothetical protein